MSQTNASIINGFCVEVASLVTEKSALELLGFRFWKSGAGFYWKNLNAGRRGRKAADEGDFETLATRLNLRGSDYTKAKANHIRFGKFPHNGTEWVSDENKVYHGIPPQAVDPNRKVVLPKQRTDDDVLCQIDTLVNAHYEEHGELPSYNLITS